MNCKFKTIKLFLPVFLLNLFLLATSAIFAAAFLNKNYEKNIHDYHDIRIMYSKHLCSKQK